MGVKSIDAAELADRLAIMELVARYSRAVDRMDIELAGACWWPDGTDDHAPLYVGSVTGFWKWLWPVLAAMALTRHVVTNTIIRFDGDKAASESYWTATIRTSAQGNSMDLQSGGRYIDSFVRRDGEWRFQHRQSIREWERADRTDLIATGSPTTAIIQSNNLEASITPSRRDRSDYSYRALGDLN